MNTLEYIEAVKKQLNATVREVPGYYQFVSESNVVAQVSYNPFNGKWYAFYNGALTKRGKIDLEETMSILYRAVCETPNPG